MVEAEHGAATAFPGTAGKLQFLQQHLLDFCNSVRPPVLPVEGKLVQMTGLTLVATGCKASIGSRCRIETTAGNFIDAEVVGFSSEKLFLMPIGRVHGLNPGARVIPELRYPQVGVGSELLGRVIDGSGEPIDKLGELKYRHHSRMIGAPINPFARQPITRALDVGVRAINGLLTVGRGQRIGLFAGSGVGKSVLLGQMTRHTEADVVVVGLIGERGREVREFVENILGKEDFRKAVVVATPADDPPLMRLHGAWRATAIAEHFRDQGKNVLLLMDSLTRFAQAQRELALAIGEPPVTRGYPPSVFAMIPQLVERAGNGAGDNSGSITAFYTVLAEGDDQQDPIADATRAILDGHIVLSRTLAEAGIYPAISVEASISRVMSTIAEAPHLAAAIKFKQTWSTYEKNRDLISVGAYRKGADAAIDYAIGKFPRLQQYLQQGSGEKASLENSKQQLYKLLAEEQS
ncbi:MAG TPA: flagellar protein export ATPase FliI [Candidatus Acidoferrum sp.]|nr:flagellar protein export ATPase FliI [Candidatus Acidoferrum sp.]